MSESDGNGAWAAPLSIETCRVDLNRKKSVSARGLEGLADDFEAPEQEQAPGKAEKDKMRRAKE